MNSPNREALGRVATLLGPITNELVFVGGRVAELLVSEASGTRVRPTGDSDAVCETATRTDYYRLGERLRVAGFREDQTPGAPICRWRHGDDLLDGIAPTQLEPPGASPQIGQARRQVGPPGKPCRPAQRGVEHEERDDAMVRSTV